MMLGIRKVLRDRNLTVPYLVVFGYIFMPLIFTLEDTHEMVASGGSASELGAGGRQAEPLEILQADPLEILGVNPLDMREGAGFVNTSRYTQTIQRPNYLNYAEAILPVDDYVVSSDFGWRVAPCATCSTDHQGVDFAPGAGTPVRAVLDGVVVQAGFAESYGVWVKIEHIVPVTEDKVERWETVYAHLQEGSITDDVRVGSVVQRGQKIGAVGNTGLSTGPHLHFELLIDGEAVDPLPVIAQTQGIKNFTSVWG